MTSLALKAIQDGIRLPDSIVVAYPPYRLQFLPSPSRILCLMDPLLPLGVLKSCIQAYTGGFPSKKAGVKENKSFTYDPSSYNAFDLDFGNDEGGGFLDNNRNNRLKHSYSETQLNIIKAKYCQQIDNSFPEENESFCSEFPYSDTEPESNTDESMAGAKTEDSDYLYFSATTTTTITGERKNENQEETSSVTTSLLQSLTNQMSSKMQGFTTSLSGFFSNPDSKKPVETDESAAINNTDEITVGHRNITVSSIHRNEVTDEGENSEFQDCRDTEITHHDDSTVENRIDDSLDLDLLDIGATDTTKQQPNSLSQSKPFSICKDCLYSTEQCICNLSPKLMRKRLEHRHSSHHYKFSHHHHHHHHQNHHKNQKHQQDSDFSFRSGRSNSLTTVVVEQLCKATSRSRREKSYNETRRIRSITQCGNLIGETESYPRGNSESEQVCSPTSKNKQFQRFRLSLLGSSDANSNSSPPSSPQSPSSPVVNAAKERGSNGRPSSPRVVYDRNTESCVILTPDDERKGTPHEESVVIDNDNNTMRALGVDSKAFSDAKDPLMSPFLADDETLKQLPPITVVVSLV